MAYKFLGAALLALVLSTPAMAQDDRDLFTGPRIEVLFGYDNLKLREAGEPEFDIPDFRASSEDIFYGAAIGYDYSNGWLLIGAEAEIAGSGHSTREGFLERIGGNIVDGTLRADTGTEYYFGARAGFVGGRTAFYVKAGYAMSNGNLRFNGMVNGEPETLRVDFNPNGLRLGVGAEHHFSRRGYIKAEYRYTDYSGGDVSLLNLSLPLGEAFSEDEIDLTRHQAIVGVGLRF
ncbi:MAG: outer membrane protein [Erythrobacter sp.]